MLLEDSQTAGHRAFSWLCESGQPLHKPCLGRKMSPIEQSGACALGKTTIAFSSLCPHATEPTLELPEKLAKKIRASPVAAERAAILNPLDSSRKTSVYFPFLFSD